MGQIHIVRPHLAAKDAIFVKMVPYTHELELSAH
jgi:hypothetical protein